MPDSYSETGNKTPGTSLSSLNAWLDSPDLSSPAESISALCEHLHGFGSAEVPLPKRAEVLDRVYMRGMTCVEKLIPDLVDTPVPVPGKARQVIRTMQEMLYGIAEQFLDLHDKNDSLGQTGSCIAPDLALWRTLHALSRHLLIGSLTASPPGIGIWRKLHQTYDLARQQGITRNTPEGTTRPLQDEYYAAVLLGCAQPASFTAREILFLDAYLERFSSQIDSNRDKPDRNPEMFWIDPVRDAPATPCSRKPPPQETPVRYFSCGRLADLLANQLEALDSGAGAKQLELPEYAATPAGRGVLRRLSVHWGDPGKRRFPRRRQNYRAQLCAGLNKIYQLFQKRPVSAETSNWMIVNESPDGYSIMHVSGRTGPITVGDVVALKTETGNNWQLCIIRWVLSENQEHLELGLQILSANAIAADLALPSGTDGNACRPVLVLPATPVLRPEESMVVPSGMLAGHTKNLVLIIEKDNIEVREINTGQRGEQNGQIEIYEIETEQQGC